MALADREDSEPFRYESLSKSRHIRLMKLLPADTQTHDIHCTLEQACLDEAVQYEALSYTWGDPSNRWRMYCSGRTLSITSNLDIALRHLRLHADSRTLWVDAVCINQADVDERNQQVALMRDVYTKACQVIAWLGEEHPSDSGAMEFGDPEPLPEHCSEKEKLLKMVHLQTKFTSSFISAKILIQRPWFSRAWIVQEAALARRLQVQCGKKVIDWESLHANLRLMNGMVDGYGDQVTFNNSSYQRLEFVDFTSRMVKGRGMANPSAQIKETPSNRSFTWQQFHSAVVNGRLYGATDERDHIYALLGLIDKSDGETLPVDYSLSYATVFRKFVRHTIQQTGSLSALGQLDSWSSTKLESWVPDYSRPSHVDPLSSDNQPAFTASGDSQVRLADPDDIVILSLSGIIFDTIDEVAMGPSTEKDEVFTRSERLMFKTADKVDPTELIPKLAIGTIRRVLPQSKEIIDSIAEAVDLKNREPASTGLGDQDAWFQGTLDLFADLSLAETKKSDNKQKARHTFDIFNYAIREWRTASKAHIFGPMHARNDVYMKPALEEQWQRIAQKCSPYPTGDHVEDAYWRTLIGNKRTFRAGNVDKPPEFWRDAYNLWHELLWEKEGMIPRFLHGRDLRPKKGSSTLRGTTVTKNKGERPLPEELRSYFRSLDAEQQKMGLDEQLRASGMRGVMSAAIKISQDPEVAKLAATRKNMPDGFELLSDETIDKVAGWVQRYPDIQPGEKDQLMEVVFPMADNKAQKEEPIDKLRAKVDQAFRYDFLRVARNRKFCVTKKRYMGWCPFNTRPGDRICILFGGQTPYVVRKEGKGYRLLGEAYIHGVMDGEVLSMPDIKMETIRLI